MFFSVSFCHFTSTSSFVVFCCGTPNFSKLRGGFLSLGPEIEIPAKHGLPVNMQSTRYKVEVLEDGSSHRKSPKGQEDLQLPRKRAYEEPGK